MRSSGVRSVSPRPVGAASHFVICPVRTRGNEPTACSPCCSHTSRRIAGGKPCLLKIVSWAARKLSKVLPARDTPHQAVSYTHTRLLQRSSAVGKSPAAWSPQALCALLLIPAAACRLPRR